MRSCAEMAGLAQGPSIECTQRNDICAQMRYKSRDSRSHLFNAVDVSKGELIVLTDRLLLLLTFELEEYQRKRSHFKSADRYVQTLTSPQIDKTFDQAKLQQKNSGECPCCSVKNSEFLTNEQNFQKQHSAVQLSTSNVV
jgi:hypothetical protein